MAGSKTFLAAAFALLVTTATVVVATEAAAPDTTNWTCSLCPFAKGLRAVAVAESGYVSDDETRYGNYTGYDDNGFYVNASGHGVYATERQRLDFELADLGLDSRHLALRGAGPGRVDYSAEYREIPWRRFDTTRTIFAGADANRTLLLPSGWQRAATTGGFANLDASLQPADIGSDRKRLGLNGAWSIRDGLEIFGGYRHEKRDGTLISAAPYFTQAAQLPRPIEFRTDEFSAGMRYNDRRNAVEVNYSGSFFDNKYTQLRWENPFTAVPGAEQGAAAESPDNSAHSLSFSARTTVLQKTVVSMTGSLARMEQDDAFLPATLNSTLGAAPLPRSSLDGRVDRSHWSVSVTSRPFGLAYLRVDASSTDRDNRTARSAFERIIVDSFTSGEPETNPAYDFARRRIRARAAADLSQAVRISGGYSFTETKRNLQEVAEQEEEDGWGKIRWRANQYLELNLKAGTAKRVIDEYSTDVAVTLNQNPLQRKYNLAHRFREYVEVDASATPPGTSATLTLSALLTNDDYSKSVVGITDSEERQLHANIAWPIGTKTMVYLNSGYRSIDSQRTGADALARSRAAHDDAFSTYGAGVRTSDIFERLEISADLQLSRGETTIGTIIDSTPVTALPDLDTEETTLRLQATYKHTARLAFVAGIYYARLKTDDWALSGVMADTVPSLLSLGAENYNYSAVRGSFGARYRFE